MANAAAEPATGKDLSNRGAFRSAPDWWLAGVASLYLLFLFPTPEFNCYNKDDASSFVLLGSNLAETGRYTTDICPGEEYGRHATWPFVFPVILAAVIGLFGHSWFALKAVMAALGVANLMALRSLWRGEAVGAWATVLTALCPGYFLFAHVTMTEIPYMLAATLTLVAMERGTGLRGSLVAGLLATLAFFTRGYAVAFVPAGALFYLVRFPSSFRRRMIAAVLFLTPLCLSIVAWKAYTTHLIQHEPLDGLTATFGNGANFLADVARPVSRYAREFYWWHGRLPGHFLLPVADLQTTLASNGLLILSCVLLVLAASGWAVSLQRRRGAVEFWVPFGIALLLVAKQAGARYWLTYVPFLFYYTLVAARFAAQRVPKVRLAYAALLSCLIAVGAVGLARHLLNPDEMRFLSPYWRDYRDAALWIREHTPGNALVIGAHSPHNFSVASQRCAYPEVSAALAADRLHRGPVYLVCPNPELTTKPFESYASAVAECQQALRSGEYEKVWQGSHLAVYLDRSSPEKLAFGSSLQ